MSSDKGGNKDDMIIIKNAYINIKPQLKKIITKL